MNDRGTQITPYGRWAIFPLIITFGWLVGCGKEPTSTQGGPLALARLTISHGPVFDFGTLEIGESREQAFVVQNIGATTATEISSDFLLSLNFQFVGGAFPGTGGDCGKSIPAGSRCEIVVEFRPQWIASFESAVRVTYFDGEKLVVNDTPIVRGRARGPVEP